MPVNDNRRGGRLPPLAEVIEFDFVGIANQMVRIEESFTRINISAREWAQSLRDVRHELLGISTLAAGAGLRGISAGRSGGGAEDERRERQNVERLGRVVATGIGDTLGVVGLAGPGPESRQQVQQLGETVGRSVGRVLVEDRTALTGGQDGSLLEALLVGRTIQLRQESREAEEGFFRRLSNTIERSFARVTRSVSRAFEGAFNPVRPTFGNFPALGVTSIPTAAQLLYHGTVGPAVREELDFQTYGRFSPFLQQQGDYLTDRLGVRPDLLQSSIRVDSARVGAAVGQFAYPAIRLYQGANRLLTGLHQSLIDLNYAQIGEIEEVFTIPKDADLPEAERRIRQELSRQQYLQRYGRGLSSTAPYGEGIGDQERFEIRRGEYGVHTPAQARAQRQALLGGLGTLGRGVAGFGLGQFVAGPVGAVIGAGVGFATADRFTAPIINYLVTDDSFSESYESSITPLLYQKLEDKLTRDFRGLFPRSPGLGLSEYSYRRRAGFPFFEPYGVREFGEDESTPDYLGYLARRRPITSAVAGAAEGLASSLAKAVTGGRLYHPFRGFIEPPPSERDPLAELLPERFFPDAATQRFIFRTIARTDQGRLGAQYGQLRRLEDFTASAIREIPEGSDLYRRVVTDRRYDSAEAAAEGFRAESRGARRLISGEIRALPFFEEIVERGAVAEAQLEGLAEASREFGQAGAEGVRSLVTDLTQLDNVAQNLVTTFAEMVLQVGLLDPVRNFLQGAFSAIYGGATGRGLEPAAGGGTVSVNPSGGWIPPGGSNVVINNSYEGVSRSQAVELAAVGRTQAVEDVRRAQGQITSDQYNGRL